MPNFFFDLECLGIPPERIRTCQPDLDSARLYALGMVDLIMRGREAEPWQVTIKDQDGGTIGVLRPEDNKSSAWCAPGSRSKAEEEVRG